MQYLYKRLMQIGIYELLVTSNMWPGTLKKQNMKVRMNAQTGSLL